MKMEGLVSYLFTQRACRAGRPFDGAKVVGVGVVPELFACLGMQFSNQIIAACRCFPALGYWYREIARRFDLGVQSLREPCHQYASLHETAIVKHQRQLQHHARSTQACRGIHTDAHTFTHTWGIFHFHIYNVYIHTYIRVNVHDCILRLC